MNPKSSFCKCDPSYNIYIDTHTRTHMHAHTHTDTLTKYGYSRIQGWNQIMAQINRSKKENPDVPQQMLKS